ncbi:MAG: hypothetical protein U0556_01735 [Dehalococcoidia bacterium]
MAHIPLRFQTPARLRVSAVFGSIALYPVRPGQEPHLEYRDDARVRFDVREGDDLVTVLIEDEAGGWGGGRSVAFYLPPAIDAEVETSVGSLSAEGLGMCRLQLKSSAGEIKIRQCIGELTVRTEAGAISGEDVGGRLQFRSEAGSIKGGSSTLRRRVRADRGRFDRGRTHAGWTPRLDPSSEIRSVRLLVPVAPKRQRCCAFRPRLARSGCERSAKGAAQDPYQVVQIDLVPVPLDPPIHRVHSRSATAARLGSGKTPPTSIKPEPELSRILAMVEAGTITASEGLDLIQALSGD